MESDLNNMDVSNNENLVGGGIEHEQLQGDLEQEIARLWKELFRLERVSRNDNFFELGGNSLLAMDLSEMFASRLALEIPVLAIFMHPTIAETARFIAPQ